MTRIIILSEVGFSERDYFRWGLNKIENFFEVKIFDFTKISYPHFFEVHREKIYKTKNYLEVEKVNEAKNLIEKFKPTFAIDNMTPHSNNSKIIRAFLKERKVKTIHIQSGLVPAVNRTIFEKIHRFFFLILRPSIFYSKINRIIRNKLSGQNKEKNCDIILLSGLKGLNKVNKNKKIIFSHSYDYEFYLNYEKNLKDKNNFKKNFIVFLDQYLPSHPGAIMRGEKPKASKEKYYPAINSFFSFLEKKSNKKVIIAPHPRADYDDFNPFQNRQLVKEKTIELVRNADIVLAHTSTSISYAILYEKPIIFLTSNEIRLSYDDFRIDSLSRELGSKLYNIDKKKYEIDFNNLDDVNKINKVKYQNFTNSYIKHPKSENISNWDIFIKYLQYKS